MSIFDSIKDLVTKYIDVYVKLIKLNFIDRTSSILGYIMYAMIGMLLFFCTVIMLGYGIMEGFCAMGLPRVAAAFLTFGVYALSLVWLLARRRKVTRYFANIFITILTEGEEETDKNS